MLRLTIIPLMTLFFALNFPQAARADSPPPVVPKVDLARYVGTWHEIARLPARFQRGCHATTATYRLRDDGRIDVINRCRKGSPTGKEREAKGVAWVVDERTNAKLKVRFFWPFSGDYWIFSLDEDYQYAMVGTPNRKYLWILSRTPTMADELYHELTAYARSIGFDTAPLIRSTPQPPNDGDAPTP